MWSEKRQGKQSHNIKESFDIINESNELIVPGECRKGDSIADRSEASSRKWKKVVASEWIGQNMLRYTLNVQNNGTAAAADGYRAKPSIDHLIS